MAGNRQRERDAFIDTIPVRPKLAVDVALHPPRDDSNTWVLERDGRQYFRIGPDLARLAGMLTGDYDLDELLRLLGDKWTAHTLSAAVAKLHQMKLIDDGREREFSAHRIQIVPPMSVQFSILDPSLVLPKVTPVIRMLSRRPAMVACAALVAGGILALLLAAGDVTRLLSAPIPPGVLLISVVGGFVGTVIHEFAHGATLTHYGARPRRMGVMLFYLVPAFFCDVSDGWLLPNPRQRVRVALAGIYAQLVYAGIAAIIGALLPAGVAHDALLVLAAVTYLAALVNLLPFIKLDGYLALMAFNDIPNLRTSAMTDARNYLAQVLYGARRSRILTQRWVVPYGLACMAFPLLVIGGVAFTLWSQIALGAGIVGALLVLAMLCGLVVAVLLGFLRIQRIARAGGARWPRLIVVNVALAAAVVVGLAVIAVPENVSGHYRVEDGKAHLFISTSAAAEQITAGTPVQLHSQGVVLQPVVGTAVIGTGSAQDASLPLADVLPFSFDTGLDLDVLAFPIDLRQPPDYPSGTATVTVGEQSVWGWLYSRYIAPVTGSS